MTPRIFLCEPSGLSTPQRALSDQWHERLFGLGFDVDQVRSHEYESDAWPVLVHRIGASSGVLVLGFKQLVASEAIWRRGTDQEQQLAATWTSSWLQLEAGIALSAGLPLLVAPETGVTEGVFATHVWTGAVRGTAVEHPDTSIIEQWATEVSARAGALADLDGRPG